MNAISGDISPMVFRQVVRGKGKKVSLSSKLLRVFLELDGKKALDTVAGNIGLSMADMRTVVIKLLELQLIEKVENEIPFLDSEFFNLLQAQLLLAVGPIADILIEEELGEFGFTAERFPADQAAKLVEQLSLNIQRKDKKEAFLMRVVETMKTKGY
jgi:hypothetical protein